MREPSRHGIRGPFTGVRGCLLALLALAGTFGARDAGAQAITRYVRDTGNINFVTTGGTLRNSASSTCAMNTSSSQVLSGIPANTTIRNAYLYWGGSGATAAYNDTTVTLNSTPVTASRTFARTWNNGANYYFFGDFANVTSIVNAAGGNATYTFAGLTVNTGAPHSGNSTCAGGWALIVIYEGTNERLRAINVFDGLDYFYGSSLTLNPDGFRVPPANIDGRIAVFTLDGDPGNSTSNNGFDEALRYNGNLLDDGLIPTGSVPEQQQFDGTINTQGVVTSYGVDVDQYDISSFLTPGATSGTTLYSAGSDLVLLMAQLVSATSDPAVNLGVTMSHTGNFVAGGTGQYTITVSNAAGVEREDNIVTVTDTLPAGFTFNAGSGTGWSCSAAGQVVTCTHAPTLNAGASFPPLTLTVNVIEPAASVNHTVTVSSASFDYDTSNNTATDPTTIVFPSLATSTKSVVDLNGGEAQPGDTLRYTINLIESGGYPIVGTSITDHIPANSTFASVVSIPAGAISAFSPPPNGNNEKGILTVTGIAIPASATRTVIFDVTVDDVSPGALVSNQATVTNPFGPDATPSSPNVTVLPSFVPGPGAIKQLYLWSDVSPLRLTRTQPSGTHPAVAINGNNQSQTFTMNVPLQSALTLNNQNFTVNLLMARVGTAGNENRTITVTLRKTIGATTTNIATASQTIPNMSTSVNNYTFTLAAPAVLAMPAGTAFSLVVNNNSGNSPNRNIELYPLNGGLFSRVDLRSATVINVDSIQTWNAAYNGGAQQGSFYPGASVFVRATVSDPFGAFDISGARIWITDAATPTAGTPVTDQPMTAVGPTCGATNSNTCVFQYQHNLPSTPTPPLGTWNIRVRANEGVEGVFDEGLDSFVVAYPQPSITMVKSSVLMTSPVPGNLKRIPQSVVRYDITVTNSGPGSVDANTLEIIDPIPANSALYVATTPDDPVVFVNGAPSSGLTFNYVTHVSYSTTGPAGPWGYTPSPNANGVDPAVRAVRIRPSGSMSAAGGGNPSFTIQFQVKIN